MFQEHPPERIAKVLLWKKRPVQALLAFADTRVIEELGTELGDVFGRGLSPKEYLDL